MPAPENNATDAVAVVLGDELVMFYAIIYKLSPIAGFAQMRTVLETPTLLNIRGVPLTVRQRKTSVRRREDMFHFLEESVRRVEVVDDDGFLTSFYFQRPGRDVVSRDCTLHSGALSTHCRSASPTGHLNPRVTNKI